MKKTFLFLSIFFLSFLTHAQQITRLTQSEIKANETPQAVAYNFVHSIVVKDYTTMAKLCTSEFYAELNKWAESEGVALSKLFTSQYMHDVVGMRPVIASGYSIVITDQWKLDPYNGQPAYSVSFNCADANNNLYDEGEYDTTTRVLLVKKDGQWKVYRFK